MAATIEFSAQFGGRDAAAAVLPHFRALKSVASNYSIEQFPFKSLAFILRVDGEVNTYGLSGPGHLDFDAANYLSVDLGIKRENYQSCSESLVNSIKSALRASVEFLRRADDERLRDVDYEKLEEEIGKLSDAYEETMGR